jgi:hypothetical protein
MGTRSSFCPDTFYLDGVPETNSDDVEISRRLYQGQTIEEIFERAKQNWKE